MPKIYLLIYHSSRIKHSLMHFEVLSSCHERVVCHKNTPYMLFSSTQGHVRMKSFIFTIENVGICISFVGFCEVTPRYNQNTKTAKRLAADNTFYK